MVVDATTNAPLAAVSASSQTADVPPLHLPTGVVSMGDARRLYRDMQSTEEMVQAIRLRTDEPAAKMPRLSRALEEFANTNRLNFLLPEDRKRAAAFLDEIIKLAPVLHISFAAEATRKFTTELILWLRSNFHPNLLLEVGLEPNIAAGCVVRTTNKVFDFSLIKHLEGKQDVLMEGLLGRQTKP